MQHFYKEGGLFDISQNDKHFIECYRGEQFFVLPKWFTVTKMVQNVVHRDITPKMLVICEVTCEVSTKPPPPLLLGHRLSHLI